MRPLILTIGLTIRCVDRIGSHFEALGFKTLHCVEEMKLLELISRQPPQIIVVGTQGGSFDEKLPLIRRIKSRFRRLPIVLLINKGNEARAIAGLKAGVTDYYTLPLCYPAFLNKLAKHIKNVSHSPPSSDAASLKGGARIVGHGQSMRQIKRYLVRLADTQSTVLITGETGTGKELIAETIHGGSPRAGNTMVCVNCAAIPENLVESELFGYRKGAFTGAIAAQKGKFALANNSTLFLDEIGEMSPIAQAKILRSIESNEIFPLGSPRAMPLDVRIIAATNRDPERLVDQGKFRRDLYYRLNVARIHLPPLRERKEDIPDLVAAGIEKLNKGMQRRVQQVSDETMAGLMQYKWPGNIRELNNLLESSLITCETKQIEFTDLPPFFIKKLNYCTDDAVNDRDRLMLALAGTHWNKSAAARKLNWSRMRVYRAIKRYNIVTPAGM